MNRYSGCMYNSFRSFTVKIIGGDVDSVIVIVLVLTEDLLLMHVEVGWYRVGVNPFVPIYL